MQTIQHRCTKCGENQRVSAPDSAVLSLDENAAQALAQAIHGPKTRGVFGYASRAFDPRFLVSLALVVSALWYNLMPSIAQKVAEQEKGYSQAVAEMVSEEAAQYDSLSFLTGATNELTRAFAAEGLIGNEKVNYEEVPVTTLSAENAARKWFVAYHNADAAIQKRLARPGAETTHGNIYGRQFQVASGPAAQLLAKLKETRPNTYDAALANAKNDVGGQIKFELASTTKATDTEVKSEAVSLDNPRLNNIRSTTTRPSAQIAAISPRE